MTWRELRDGRTVWEYPNPQACADDMRAKAAICRQHNDEAGALDCERQAKNLETHGYLEDAPK